MYRMTVSELIRSVMFQESLSKEDVVRRMECKKLQKGLEELERILHGSYLEQHQISQLSKALEVERAEVISALLETHRRAELKEKKTVEKEFRPHLCAICEKSEPPPNTFGGAPFNVCYLYFEVYFPQLPKQVQLAEVEKKIKEHFRARKGKIYGFGNILHYVLKNDINEMPSDMLFFNTDGKIIENAGKDLRGYPGDRVELSVRRKNRDQLLKLKSARNKNSGEQL